MSGLNNFLILIQRVFNAPYSALGDLIYGINLECIRSYYRAYLPPHLLTEAHRIVDAELRGTRQNIEFQYGKGANVFSICSEMKNFRLAGESRGNSRSECERCVDLYEEPRGKKIELLMLYICTKTQINKLQWCIHKV